MIVRHNEVIKLYCKGYTEVIYEILAYHENKDNVELNASLLRSAGSKGLRVTCMAMRIVSESEFSEFDKRIERAMKIFNEVKAECAGTVAEVCVKNGDTVDFGTVLFRVELA